MILFRIHFDSKVHKGLYNSYCKFLFKMIKRTIHSVINPKKYKVREKVLLESSFIKWISYPPKRLDLAKLVENSLVMKRWRGEYIITLDYSKKLRGSTTKVSDIIRLLEYGAPGFPPYPVITRVLLYYSKVYRNLMIKFMKDQMR